MILTRDVWYEYETIPNVNGTIHENDKKKILIIVYTYAQLLYELECIFFLLSFAYRLDSNYYKSIVKRSPLRLRTL